MPSLHDVRENKDSLAYQIHQIFQEAGPELDFSKVRCIPGTTEEKIAKYHALERELTDVGAEYDRLKRIQVELQSHESRFQSDSEPVNQVPFEGGTPNGNKGIWTPNQYPANSIRKILDASPELKNMRERNQGSFRVEIPFGEYKALITLTTVSPQNDRGALVRQGMEERTVIDMIGESSANASVVEWYEENALTNVAVEVAEGVAKPEATLGWTLRNTTIKTIAVWVPVTKQSLQDNDFLESEIRNRLIYMVQRREEGQVLNGDAAGENMRGILNTSGIQTQAKGADATAVAIFKAIAKIGGSAGSAFLDADGIVMHPLDVVDLMTVQATDGAFLMQAVLQNAPVVRLWGLPIRQTTAIPENTALVGAFARSAEVFRIGGLSVDAASEHGTYFTENKIAIRAESRIGLAVQIPVGFCTVTGV